MDPEWKRRFTWIDIDEVRRAFLKEPFPARGDRGDLASLQESIRRHGLIQPILTRVRNGKLQVVCGYRRWLAAQISGLQRIPVIVSRLSDDEAQEIFREEEAFHGRARGEALQAVVDGPGTALVQSDGSGVPAATLAEPLESGGRPTSRLGVGLAGSRTRERLDIYARIGEIYEGVRRERRLPDDDVEDVAERLRLLNPVGSGLDIRELGGDVAGEASESAGISDNARALSTHAMRVASLAQHLARRFSWPEEAVRRIGMAGILYDVGMLFIPHDWYRSPYPLTTSRKETIKSHTLIGMEVISQSGVRYSEFAVVAREHHERWDGTGYPDGKEGREVALNARLIGLVDSYVAMISDRAYREAYLLAEALGMIEDAAGVGIYEPALVKQVLGHLTSCPVGLAGRLEDRTLVRVVDVRPQVAKSHLVQVLHGPSRYTEGERIWFREAELRTQLTEVPLTADIRAAAATPASRRPVGARVPLQAAVVGA